MFFVGDIIYDGDEGCFIEHDYMDFKQGDVFSQFVLSESAATCMANQIAKSKIGHIEMNTKTIQGLMGDIKYDTTELNTHLPILV